MPGYIPPSILNLGCGSKPIQGCLNADKVSLPGVDVCFDMLQYPWPFPNERFAIVYTSHLAEHVPHGEDGYGFIRWMEEIHRVLKPKGRLVIICPHPDDQEAAWADPTHCRVLYPRTFTHFDSEAQNSHYTQARFKLVWHGVISYKHRLCNTPLRWLPFFWWTKSEQGFVLEKE